jgi:hypothetical protein
MKLSKEEMGILKDFIWAMVDDAIDTHERDFHGVESGNYLQLLINQKLFDKTFLKDESNCDEGRK